MIHETDNTAASLFSEIESLSVSFASFALNTNEVWPNVTEPYFAEIVETAQNHLHFEAFLLAPVIRSQTEKKAFESYATANQDWLRSRNGNQDNLNQFDPISPTIFRFPDSEEPPSSVQVPVWQYGPFPQDSALTLMDLNTHPILRRSIEIASSGGRAVLSETFNADFILEHLVNSKERGRHLRRQPGDSVDESDDLFSMYLQPVFTNFTEEKTVAAFVIAVISWRTFFSSRFLQCNEMD